MTRTTSVPTMTPQELIELSRLSLRLSRCTDQAECDRVMARMAEIEGK